MADEDSDVHKTAIRRDNHIADGVKIGAFTTLADCTIGKGTTVWRCANLYGCDVGSDCMVGSLVEIQADVHIGNGSRIQSHAFICSKVTIGRDVFVSHGAKFINDRYPPSGDSAEWEATTVGEGASIGTNATLLPVDVGKDATIGAGAVVTEDVPPNAIVAGNPAEVIGWSD